eukprot:3983782-Pyramimonas_sp.AAC.1
MAHQVAKWVELGAYSALRGKAADRGVLLEVHLQSLLEAIDQPRPAEPRPATACPCWGGRLGGFLVAQPRQRQGFRLRA